MIKVGYRYKAFNVKEVKGNKYVFQIGDRGKDGVVRYASVMVNATEELGMFQDRDEVLIENITGASLSEYNGKLQVTLYADISINGEIIEDEVVEEEDFSLSGIKISSEDLPF